MELYEYICENREKIKSDFDIAALGYEYLIGKIEILGQSNFIGQYLVMPEKRMKGYNPNLGMLRKFAEQIEFVLCNSCYFLDVKLDEILDYISYVKQKLKPFGETVYNEATIAYHLLLGFDLYAENYFKDSQPAPLNIGCQTKAYFYCCQKGGMITAASKELRFRKRILPTELRNTFTCLRILERVELPFGANPPQMSTLYIYEKDEDRNQIIKDQKLNITIIPFGRKTIFGFEKYRSASFRVKYREAQKKKDIEKALQLLDMAILRGANIVVFPEYVCFPEMQERISKYLRKTHIEEPDKIKKLLLVVAGSGWTEDDNNVCIIYSYDGFLLGKQYKYAPFNNEVKVLTGAGKKQKETWIEGLNNPGKESSVVQIPKIGSVMSAICKDISSREFSEKMARAFQVDFLMVPAYSSSLRHAFQNQLKSITETNMETCSVVCNCCAGIKEERWETTKERGMVIMPCKSDTDTVVGAKCRNVLIKNIILDKCMACEQCGECMFTLSLNFCAQNVKKGTMLSIKHSIN